MFSAVKGCPSVVLSIKLLPSSLSSKRIVIEMGVERNVERASILVLTNALPCLYQGKATHNKTVRLFAHS